MAKVNPNTAKIKALEEQVKEAMRSESYERGQRQRMQDEVESVRSDLKEQQHLTRQTMDRLNDQMMWMRNLVEMMALPADKFKELREQGVRIGPDTDPFTGRRLM